MVQTWLAPNRRVLILAMVLPASVAIGGAVLLAAEIWLVGGILLAVGILVLAALAAQMILPRIGYRPGCVLFYLRGGRPVEVPLEVVEAFLIGQGPTLRPGERHRREQTRTVIVRLAEKAVDWGRRDVKPSLGAWCEGYITIRGTWCEPIDLEVVKRLNRQLAEAQRAYREEVSDA